MHERLKLSERDSMEVEDLFDDSSDVTSDTQDLDNFEQDPYITTWITIRKDL
jgi:hypothetical protein